VPADRAVVEVIRRHRLGPSNAAAFERVDHETLRIAHGTTGTCVFRKNDRCEIHSIAGEHALPIACRHYPRVVLRDPRGTLVSLSHYCPTAASLLTTDDGARLVAASDALILQEPIEGLDARGELPPLVRPGLLTDIDGYAAWEAKVIETFDMTCDADRAFQIIELATDQLRLWSPQGSLTDAVGAAFENACNSDPRNALSIVPLSIVAELLPSEHRLDVSLDLDAEWASRVTSADVRIQRIIVNYLSARAFGNWVAYQGQGLRTIVAWLRACYDVLRLHIVRSGPPSSITRQAVLEAVRHTDLVMLHTIDSAAFARHSAATLEARTAA
jgi:hypothetical protein